MEGILKIVKSLEAFALLIKGATQTIGYKTKKQRLGFLGILLGKLVDSLL